MCGSSNPARQRFCDECGTALAGVGAASPTSGPSDGPPRPDLAVEIPGHLAKKIRAAGAAVEGERKHVTVLFADVVGSMALAEGVDPEDWQRVMERLFAILCAGVHRFEGTVDKFTGDGIMALFGAPIAHEDHAQRACFAALHLERSLDEFAAKLRREEGINLSLRMGLNSGEVIVGAIGEDLGMEYTAVGHTVGLAQRMEQLAEPGKAYLTHKTASLVEGYVVFADLGEYHVKGVSRALRVFELTGVGTARGRLDVSRARGLGRFIGREDEMQVLDDALENALNGRGQVVGIVGEAGVGKSRLCHEFAQRCKARGMPVYQVAGQAHAKSVPLLPVLQLMRAYFEIGDQDAEQTARERIAGKLLLLDQSFADDLPLMFDFLGVPDAARRPPRMDPEARQRLLLGLTKRLMRAESDRQPSLNVFEDLHWLDPASEVFLASYVAAVQGQSRLTIVNFRPAYHTAWMSKPHYRQIALAPLGPEAIGTMLQELLGPDPSLEDLPDLIRMRAGGNPFFIEEVVQSLVESGNLRGARGAYTLTRPVDVAAVPPSVHAVLSARIDRLAAREKAVLRAAAVIGKEFSEPLLARVAGLREAELADALRRLVGAEFIYERELYPEVVYAFVHPLTQEVAYGSRLSRRRAALHAQVATAIAELQPDRLDEQSALLAEHWQAAEQPLEAARWHARAAAWSGTSDPVQSLRHWREAQHLADSLPESADTAALALTARIFRLQFGWRLGVSHDEAKAVFREAEEMAASTGDIRSRAVLFEVYGAILGVGDGDVRSYADLGRRALALAEESGDPTLYMTVAGGAYAVFSISQFREGIAILDRAIELSDGDPTFAAVEGLGCPLAYCHIFRGGITSYVAKLDEASGSIELGMKMAREHGDVETIGWGHMWATWLAYLEGDFEAMASHAQQAFEIAERLGDSFSQAWSWTWLGFAYLVRERWQDAIEALERANAISRERHTAAERTAWRLALLAEATLGAGDSERARALADDSVQLARARGQPDLEAFSLLSLARVLIGSPGHTAREQVEPALDRALQLARDLGAPVLEAIVHVELAELGSLKGHGDERERELGEAYRIFSEVGARGHAERLASQLAISPGR